MKEGPMDDKPAKADKELTIPKEGKVSYGLEPELAVVLYPALGNPAVVHKKKNGPGFSSLLSMVILSQSDRLAEGIVTQHLKISSWDDRDKGSAVEDKRLRKIFETDPSAVTIKYCGPADPNRLGLGPSGTDDGDGDSPIKLSRLNVFPWVLKGLKKFGHIHKITVDLKNVPEGMYNIWWVNKDDYVEVRERARWWNLIRHMKDFSTGASGKPRPFKRELKEFGEIGRAHV
jgi:hypothetical protein